MSVDSIRLAPLLQRFFIDYLGTQKQASSETIHSYRDTFRLLLSYVKDIQGIEPTDLRIADLSVDVVLSFLDHLERNRSNSVRSRNLRLAAIRAFFRLVALNDPASVNQAQMILAIPSKRAERRLVRSLTRREMEALLAAPCLDQQDGRRDHALLLTLYNSGARISELLSLRKSQVVFGSRTFLAIKGKGRKERTVPIWNRTAAVLQSWFHETERFATDLAFPSAVGHQLTRNGFNYLLQRAVSVAAKRCSSLCEKSITPHMLRHYAAHGNMPNSLLLISNKDAGACALSG